MAAPSTTEKLRLCAEILACQNIGDEQAYTKNLKKQGAAGQEDAQRLLAAWDWLLGVEAELVQAAANLRILGHDNLANIIEAVPALSSPDAVVDDNWHMCNITGAVSAQTIAVPVLNHGALPGVMITDRLLPAPAMSLAGPHFRLDAGFRFFVTALWVTAHVRALESSRVLAFSPPPSAVSLHDRVHAFLADPDAATTDALAVYAKCVDYTLASLRGAIAHFSAEAAEGHAPTDSQSAQPLPRPHE